MTNTDSKSQLPFASPIVSASSIVDSHGSCSWPASTAQGLQGWHAERVSIAECMQFIPRDVEAGAALSAERVLEMQMLAQKYTDESGGTEDAIRSGDWRLLAERASKEMDPDKLMTLVEELNRLLEDSPRPHSRALE